MGWGAIVLSVLMVLTVVLNWPKWLHYVWAVMVLISGLLSF